MSESLGAFIVQLVSSVCPAACNICARESWLDALTRLTSPIKNGDFDVDTVADPRGYTYSVTPSYWEANGNVVMVQQGNNPWGGLSSGSGINYISIQGSGAYIQQTITGVTPGVAYEISFLCSSRPGYGDDETFNVQVDGNVIWETGHPPDSAFGEESAIFTARTNTAVLRIENDSPAGDQSVLIDAVTIARMELGAPLTMTNPGFEDDVLTEAYTYMTPAGWVSSATVVAQNGNGPWGGLTSGVGANYLSIQGNGAYVEQTLRGLQSGTVYEVRFLAAERPGYGGDESLAVKVDGVAVWESTHPAEVFQVYRVAFTAQSPDGTAVLRFENDSPSGDRSIFVDDISVAACLDCTPTIDLSTCVVNNWQPVSTGLADDWQIVPVSGNPSKTGRDIRSGNPGETTEVRLPSIASAQPVIRLRFNYQYVVGYGRYGADVPANVRGPSFTVSVVNAATDARSVVYTSPELSGYDYDTCAENGGWGDDGVDDDGCYSPATRVDVPVDLRTSEFYILFTFSNNDRNMHLNEDGMNMAFGMCGDEVCSWQPVPTGLGDDFSVAAPASKTGRDIRSGNPHEVNTARLPDIMTAFPPQRLSFTYEYVVGYGRWGLDVPADVQGPTFTVGLVDAGTGAETVVYTSDELSTYDYDTCAQNGGWGDDMIVGDGCYSAPVDVDVPVVGFAATEFYVQFTFTNNDRNMHLNEDGLNMLVAGCSTGAVAAELANPNVPAASRFCNDFTTSNLYDYTPNFMDTQLGPMKAVQFSVRASNDAHVAFFDHDINDAAWTGNGHEQYEIVISGWGNTQSVIRQSAQGTTEATADTTGFLSATEDRNFWASALNGLVRVGTGPVVGHNLIMEWQDPEPINPEYAAVSTGWGAEGKWHICVVEGDVPPVDGSAVEFHHSQGGDVRPSIVNGDFDLNPVLDDSGYTYEAPTFWESGGSGIVMVQQGNNPWGGLSSGSGINYISIQGSGAYIQQTITGVTPGVAYEISFLCSSRPGYGDDETFNVQVDGNVIWETGHPPDSAFGEESAIFTARTNTAVLRIENDSPAGDQSVLIDAVTIARMELGAPLTMTNPGFEDDVLTEAYTYMTPAGWVSSATVVAQNGNGPWGGLTSGVGANYLSIQGNGAYVEQTLRGLQSGTVYEVRFLAAERPGYGGDESLAVKVDGVAVWESTHPAEVFQVYRVAFTAQSPDGTAVLRFENDSPSGDRSIFVDDISVAACLDCTPTIDLSTCVVNNWQPVSTGLADDWQIVPVSGNPSKTGRDIRSGNPGETTEVRLPSIASAQPVIRLRFNYQYVVGYGRYGADVPANVRGPSFTVSVVNAATDARSVVYTSPELSGYDYDTCAENGGWGDDGVDDDGCYSPATRVDVPVDLRTSEFYILFTFSNNDRNMHLNEDGMNMAFGMCGDEVCSWQPVPTGLGDDFSVAAPASKTGRDIRSGNPHEVNTARLPDIMTAFPPQRLSFTYEYVVGYGRWGLDVPADVQGPTFTVGLVDAGTGAETVVYTSDELSTYDYDTCAQNGGWGDDMIVGDGCYSAPVDVDVPVVGFAATEFYVQFTFTNNDRNMHLNEDGLNMQIAACADGAAAALNAGIGTDASFFIRESAPVPLVQGTQHAIIHVPADYAVGFQITPNDNILSVWGNIVHLTATGENCCNYGDRVPGIWFHPGTRRLHIRDGHGTDGNAGCDPEEQLSANVPTTVRVEMRPGFVEVWFGEPGSDELRCTAARGDRQTFDNVVVYAADPWHAAADASINNFYVKELEPLRGCIDHTACNTDDHATVDDGSCRYADAGYDCLGNAFSTYSV